MYIYCKYVSLIYVFIKNIYIYMNCTHINKIMDASNTQPINLFQVPSKILPSNK